MTPAECREKARELLADGPCIVTLTLSRSGNARMAARAAIHFVAYDGLTPIDGRAWDRVDISATMRCEDPEKARVFVGALNGPAASPDAIDLAAYFLLLRLSQGDADPSTN